MRARADREHGAVQWRGNALCHGELQGREIADQRARKTSEHMGVHSIRLANAARDYEASLKRLVRIPPCSSPSFAEKAAPFLSEELKPSLAPLLETISHLSKQIYCSDKEISRLGRQEYPETAQLRQVSGVGPVTALEYVLVIGNPKRFATSRDVGPYLGLTPQRDQSGDTDRQLRIEPRLPHLSTYHQARPHHLASTDDDRVHGDCALSAGVLRRHTDCSADLLREPQCAPTPFERVSRVRMEAWRIRDEH